MKTRTIETADLQRQRCESFVDDTISVCHDDDGRLRFGICRRRDKSFVVARRRASPLRFNETRALAQPSFYVDERRARRTSSPLFFCCAARARELLPPLSNRLAKVVVSLGRRRNPPTLGAARARDAARARTLPTVGVVAAAAAAAAAAAPCHRRRCNPSNKQNFTPIFA